jgi:hypothetical protein
MVNNKICEDVLDDIDEIKPDIPEEDSEEDTGEEMLHRFVCMAPVYVNDPERYERIVDGILSVRADSYRIVRGTYGTKTFTFMFNAVAKSLLRILFDVLTRTELDIYRIYPDGKLSPVIRSTVFGRTPILSKTGKGIIADKISVLSGGIVRRTAVINFIDRTMARRMALSS